MKLVSASKLKRARDAVEKSRPHTKILNNILGYVSKEMTDKDKRIIEENFPLLFGKNSQKYLLIVIGSDRGLCGSFNNNIIKEAKEGLARLLKEKKQVSILCIGDMVYRALKKEQEIEVVQCQRSLKTTEEMVAFAQDLVLKFHEHEFDVCEMYYTTFLSPVMQRVTTKTLLPFQKNIEIDHGVVIEEKVVFECSPGRVLLLKDLITQVLNDTVFSVIQDAVASEHGARMTAMDNATRNANEMIDSLTSAYNKRRQAAVTTELVEIISGAEAINEQ